MKSFFLLIISLALVFSSCQNQSGQPDLKERLSDSSSVTGLTGDAVKLVKTAAINLKVKEVQPATKAMALLANHYGGMVFYQDFQAPETGREELKISDDSLMVITSIVPQADITVRIPVENLQSFLFDATNIAYHTGSSQLKIEDKSLSYLQNEQRQENRKNVFHTSSKSDSSIKQIITTKDEAVEQFIANKTINADAAYSTVNLVLYQNTVVRKEMIANYNLSDYQLPVGTRLMNALSRGWDSFLNFMLAVLHLWVFILALVLSFFVYKYYQRRNKLPVQAS